MKLTFCITVIHIAYETKIYFSNEKSIRITVKSFRKPQVPPCNGEVATTTERKLKQLLKLDYKAVNVVWLIGKIRVKV